MSDTDRTTVTRRKALQHGTLFLGAGLLGSAGTTTSAVSAETPPLSAPISLAFQPDDGAFAEYLAEWHAEYLAILEQSADLDRQARAHPAWDRGLAQLNGKECDAHGDSHMHVHALAFELLCRHLPGLAPALRVVWRHVHEDALTEAIRGELDEVTACCRDHVTY